MGLNDFKKCKKCGNIFRYIGNPLCPKCVNKMEDEFKEIKDYLYKNANATVKEIADELEIDEKTIIHFIKEGRLEMKSADGSIVCEKCGMAITSGRLCKNCSTNLSEKLSSVLPQEPKKQQSTLSSTKTGSKMHIER